MNAKNKSETMSHADFLNQLHTSFHKLTSIHEKIPENESDITYEMAESMVIASMNLVLIILAKVDAPITQVAFLLDVLEESVGFMSTSFEEVLDELRKEKEN